MPSAEPHSRTLDARAQPLLIWPPYRYAARRATGGPPRQNPSLTPGQRRWRMARAWHTCFTLAGRYSTCWNP
jgi:hypothetical protein